MNHFSQQVWDDCLGDYSHVQSSKVSFWKKVKLPYSLSSILMLAKKLLTHWPYHPDKNLLLILDSFRWEYGIPLIFYDVYEQIVLKT